MRIAVTIALIAAAMPLAVMWCYPDDSGMARWRHERANHEISDQR